MGCEDCSHCKKKLYGECGPVQRLWLLIIGVQSLPIGLRTRSLKSICARGNPSVIPCFTGDNAEDLVRVLCEPVAFAIGWIVYHETSRNSARIRAVVDMLAAFFETQKARLHGRRA
jgi:DNA-binding transcriptional LysR family regulator